MWALNAICICRAASGHRLMEADRLAAHNVTHGEFKPADYFIYYYKQPIIRTAKGQTARRHEVPVMAELREGWGGGVIQR